MKFYWDEEDAPADVRERWACETAEQEREFREAVAFVFGCIIVPSAPISSASDQQTKT